MHNNNSIVYAHSDKEMGPVSIKTKRYNSHGIKHLKDTSTYVIISKD